MRLCTLASVLLPVILVCQAAGAELDARIGQAVEDFELRDYRGRTWSLSEAADKKLRVIAFVGTECPLAKLYAPRLAELADRFEPKGVGFLAINSNQQDSVTEIAAHARIHGIDFPVLKDPANFVADLFGAERTPEVFLIDEQNIIRYRGRIDDQYGVGYQRTKPTRNDLAVAIEELLAGQPVSKPSLEAVGCIIGRIRTIEPHGKVTYAKQISRIFQRHCVECHRTDDIAPFPLTTYEDTIGWGEMIVEVIQQQRMPPWLAAPGVGHFANANRLSDHEKQLIETWVGNGCPQGDPADLPEPRQFTEGWRIEQPDKIYYMRKKPFTVPAEGVVKYQHFMVDPGFTEDQWIKAAEVRPGNRAVVHHAAVFLLGGTPGRPGLTDALLALYVPGYPPVTYTDGSAVRIPAGSKFVFQLHYTPNGSVQEDRTYVGFKFADPDSVTTAMSSGGAINRDFEIPPGASDHPVKSGFKFQRAMSLVSLYPHMHLRGKSFQYTAVYPDGRREVLLDVPRYDFNWQLRYDLAEPKAFPAGTRLECHARFDNSPDNLLNPDPSETVRWGNQTWEEMMIGYFYVSEPRSAVRVKDVDNVESNSSSGGQ